ncbi:hypothetical protein CEXT_77111 [Caerostris extrusa]|uniref:Uncharacterized protein n=1 Tax=Caerostris extrusa TaxID=172846 RepID=A0AAV4MVB9_CAEEX|nr:hypothetical protein CEXT_77111 [Caerostris extrusa]
MLITKRNDTEGNLLSNSERVTVVEYLRHLSEAEILFLPPESHCAVDFASGPIRHPGDACRSRRNDKKINLLSNTERVTVLQYRRHLSGAGIPSSLDPVGICKLPYYLVMIMMNARASAWGFF